MVVTRRFAASGGVGAAGGGAMGREEGESGSSPKGHAPNVDAPPLGGSGTFQVWSPGVGSLCRGKGGRRVGGGVAGRTWGAGETIGFVEYPTVGVGADRGDAAIGAGGGGLAVESPSGGFNGNESILCSRASSSS